MILIFITKYCIVLNLNEQPEVLSLDCRFSAGHNRFRFISPKEGEFGYKNISNVITLPEFNRLMELCPDRLIFNNKPIKKVAFIYCVGNRQTKGENKYCSRQCCTSAIYTSIQLKEKYKNITSFHLYRDIRTYGKQEILFENLQSKVTSTFVLMKKNLPSWNKLVNL